jgi:hypothetical protein
VEGVCRHGRLFPDELELSLELHDGVLEAADPVDLDGDDVSRLDWARVGRSAGEKHIAGLERDEP